MPMCATGRVGPLRYMRSLHWAAIPVEPYLHVLLTRTLSRAGMQARLQQMLQYHVPSDSLYLARVLLEESQG